MARRLAAFLITASAMLGAPSVATADDIVGDWATACLPDVTCYASIRPQGDGYRLEWEAAGRTTSETYCEASADLMVGEFEQRDLVLPSVPNGVLESGVRVMVMTIDPSQIHIWTDDSPCGQVEGVRGYIVMNGVYDLFGDM